MTVKELQAKYKSSQDAKRTAIKSEPSKWKRFWKWVWYLIAYPFEWLWVNIRDWRSAVILAITMLIVASSVWLFYLIGFLLGGASTETGKLLIGIGSAVWVWWLSPIGSPYILICVCITIGIKALFDKHKERKDKNGK